MATHAAPSLSSGYNCYGNGDHLIHQHSQGCQRETYHCVWVALLENELLHQNSDFRDNYSHPPGFAILPTRLKGRCFARYSALLNRQVSFDKHSKIPHIAYARPSTNKCEIVPRWIHVVDGAPMSNHISFVYVLSYFLRILVLLLLRIIWLLLLLECWRALTLMRLRVLLRALLCVRRCSLLLVLIF